MLRRETWEKLRRWHVLDVTSGYHLFGRAYRITEFINVPANMFSRLLQVSDFLRRRCTAFVSPWMERSTRPFRTWNWSWNWNQDIMIQSHHFFFVFPRFTRIKSWMSIRKESKCYCHGNNFIGEIVLSDCRVDSKTDWW